MARPRNGGFFNFATAFKIENPWGIPVTSCWVCFNWVPQQPGNIRERFKRQGTVSNVGLSVTVHLVGEHPKRWVYFTHVWCWFLETQVDISTTCHVSHRPWTTIDLQWSERRSCTSVKMAVISHAVGQIIAAAGMEKNNFDCLLKIHKVFSCSYNNWI